MNTKVSELNVGSHINFRNKIWRIVSKSHVKPGKGGAYSQLTLKSNDNVKLEQRFSTSDSVDLVIVETKKYNFSYSDGNSIFVIDPSTYDSIEISDTTIAKESIDLIKKFATDDIEVSVEYADEKIINVTLPSSIKVKVDLADPVVKGQTAASSYKGAIIKEDVKILVPPYISQGDEIIINLYGDKGIEFVSRV